jgi:hypothetical protein
MFETIRHWSRFAVNWTALILAVLSLPELGYVVPVAWLPAIVAITALLNTVLTILRRV